MLGIISESDLLHRAEIGTGQARQATIVAAENSAGVEQVHDHLCFVDSYSGFHVEAPEDMKAAS